MNMRERVIMSATKMTQDIITTEVNQIRIYSFSTKQEVVFKTAENPAYQCNEATWKNIFDHMYDKLNGKDKKFHRTTVGKHPVHSVNISNLLVIILTTTKEYDEEGIKTLIKKYGKTEV